MIFSLCVLFLVTINIYSINASSIVNKEVTRTIDASSSVVKVYVEIKATNVNKEYQVAFPSDLASNLAFLSIKQNKKELLYTGPTQQDANVTLYTVSVNDASPTLKLEAVFTSSLEPYPKEIAQGENQYVKLKDSHLFLSPYKTETQKTTIKLASSTVESYTKRAPHAHRQQQIIYGPYKEIKPFEYSPATIHYLNNKPFAKFSTMQREVEVSHWGNIAIEEVYELKHAGSKLSGGFSRFDYQMKRTASSPSFRNLIATLPLQANNIYYRDQIGNISTSDMRVDDGVLELDIQTRFPIFGGWQTQFYIGYSVPTETALFVAENDRYKLKFDFFTIFEDVWVEDMEIKVVLPEGCTDIKVEVPYPVEQSWTRRYTYLDSDLNGGRPVLTMRAKNLVEEHDKQIVISYTFSRNRMFVEPLMLIVAFFSLFIVASIISRIETKKSVSSDSSNSGKSKEQ